MEAFSAFDLLDFEMVSDPRLSPCGDNVAYVRHHMIPEEDAYSADIYCWIGGDIRRLTRGAGVDTHPRWSPDGRCLAFLSDRPVNEDRIGRQLWVIPSHGGEPVPLTRVEGGLLGFRWSPSGRQLALVTRCDPDRGITEVPEHPDDVDDPTDRASLFCKYNADVRHITKIRYKVDGIGFLEGKRTHVGVIPFDPDAGPAAPIPVTSGDFDHAEPAWSPDERWLAVSACRAEDPDIQTFSDIWLFAADGDGDPIRVTESRGPANKPAWSPDGRRIAYLGHGGEIGGGYENTRLWYADVHVCIEGGCELVDVTGGTDVSLASTAVMDMCLSGGSTGLTWAEDASEIYHYAAERGTVQAVRVCINSGRSTFITRGDRAIYDLDVDPARGRAVAAVATPENPGEIVLFEIPDDSTGEILAGRFGDDVLDQGGQVSKEQVIVATNQELLANRRVYPPKRFNFETEDGYRVDGWYIAPESNSQNVPTVLQIHGGIMGMYTSCFYFELQLLAASGYGVLYSNPRGSSGYGEAFRSAVAEGWGPSIYPDLMAALEVGLSQYPIDPERLGVAGGSAGGYMTNWVIAHTDRFNAAVSMRSVANKHSMWGTSDNAFLWGERYGGFPWENPDEYLRQSPLHHFGGVTTPTLVIHSEEDYRCPMEQGEQVYMTLKRQGVETEFLRYPGESHGLSRSGKPWHRVHRLDRIRDWFARHL